MAIKCIAIGNRIMGDDSIGIVVLEALSYQFMMAHIEMVFGETDIDYSLSKIDNGDFLFVLDATYLDIEPGTVTVTPLSNAMKQHKQIYSQHQPNLIDRLNINGKFVQGFLIGIEIQEINFSLELSDILKNKLSYICEEVSRIIDHQIRRLKDA